MQKPLNKMSHWSEFHINISNEKPFVIKDWADNLMNFGRFKTFEDAEEFLCEKLDKAYETDRQEYFIVKDTKL